MKFILCVAQVLVMVHYALAWQNISEFETGIVGALSNNLVLTSRAFSDSLMNVIARPFNDETGMAARIVNGVRESRLYIETMDEDHLDKALPSRQMSAREPRGKKSHGCAGNRSFLELAAMPCAMTWLALMSPRPMLLFGFALRHSEALRT